MCAEIKWRRLHGFDYLAKVIEGVPFENSMELKTEDRIAA